MQDWTDSALKDHALRAHAARALAPSPRRRAAREPSRVPLLACLLVVAIGAYLFVSAL